MYELARFISSLEFTLRLGVGVEKMGALRRCVAKVTVDRDAGRAVVVMRALLVVGGGGEGEVVEIGVALA